MVKRVRLSVKEFAIIWNTSQNPGEVAERTGLSKGTILTRAKRYRDMGINLRELDRTPQKPRFDVKDINEFLVCATNEGYDDLQDDKKPSLETVQRNVQALLLKIKSEKLAAG